MASLATWATQVDSLQIGAVAGGVSARGVSVCYHVVLVKKNVGVPSNRMEGGDPANMALRTGRSGSSNAVEIGSVAFGVSTTGRSILCGVTAVEGVGEVPPVNGVKRSGPAQMALRAGGPGSSNAVEIGSVAVHVGAASGSVQLHVVAVESRRIIPPLGGMDGILIAEVTLGAGDLGNPAPVIRSVTFSTGVYMGLSGRHMTRRHPAGRMGAVVDTEVGLRIRIPATGQGKDQKC